MSHLQPVAKADKNGKIVTRHVLAEKPSATQRKLPAPDGATTTTPEQRATEYKKNLVSRLKERNVRSFERWKLMRTLNPDTIPTLLEHQLTEKDELPLGYLQCCEYLGTFTPLNSFAAYLQDGGKLLRAPNKDPYESYHTMLYLLGLNEATEGTSIPPKTFTPYAKASPEERATQRKIMEATHELGLDYMENGKHIGVYAKTLSSYPLIDYIRNNPDQSETIVQLIKDRGIKPKDTQNIETLLRDMEGTTTPLRNGLL
jgi:hypothetical protein